jgi:hypothetical protein
MMLCSKCNTEVKPVVAIDIDGTLGQYHPHFLSFAMGYFNRSYDDYTGVGSLAEHMKVTKEEYRQCKLAYRLGGLKRTMPTYLGAQLLCDAVRLCGAELWVTTTRPYLRLDNTDPDTREWLNRNDFTYDGLLYDEDKYAILLDIVGKGRIVAVVEDDADCYDRAEELGLNPILVQRRHNQPEWKSALTTDQRNNLCMNDVRATVLERIEQWKDQNG